MRDAALGKNKSERALGNLAPSAKILNAGKKNKVVKKITPPRNGDAEKRVSSPGIYSGPRGAYQRYQVGSASTDILKKGAIRKDSKK
jgi:hypothetical protein